MVQATIQTHEIGKKEAYFCISTHAKFSCKSTSEIRLIWEPKGNSSETAHYLYKLFRLSSVSTFCI